MRFVWDSFKHSLNWLIYQNRFVVDISRRNLNVTLPSTLSECAYYKSAMKDIPVDYIKIYPNVSNETFSLCRVDLQ